MVLEVEIVVVWACRGWALVEFKKPSLLLLLKCSVGYRGCLGRKWKQWEKKKAREKKVMVSNSRTPVSILQPIAVKHSGAELGGPLSGQWDATLMDHTFRCRHTKPLWGV